MGNSTSGNVNDGNSDPMQALQNMTGVTFDMSGFMSKDSDACVGRGYRKYHVSCRKKSCHQDREAGCGEKEEVTGVRIGPVLGYIGL